jgi:phage gpG-like protein
MNVSVKVHGDAELKRKMSNRLYAQPVSRFFRSAGQVIKGRALDEVGRFDGLLANSIQVETQPAFMPTYVRVGSNAEYAAAHELGSRPHFPPISAIAPWARAHGIEPGALAVSISRKGTKPHPFLKPALDNSKGDIIGLIYRMGQDIERMAGAA